VSIVFCHRIMSREKGSDNTTEKDVGVTTGSTCDLGAGGGLTCIHAKRQVGILSKDLVTFKLEGGALRQNSE
jgi:hypothetical protein